MRWRSRWPRFRWYAVRPLHRIIWRKLAADLEAGPAQKLLGCLAWLLLLDPQCKDCSCDFYFLHPLLCTPSPDLSFGTSGELWRALQQSPQPVPASVQPQTARPRSYPCLVLIVPNSPIQLHCLNLGGQSGLARSYSSHLPVPGCAALTPHLGLSGRPCW